MASSAQPCRQPEVLWAQTFDKVIVTFAVRDVKRDELKVATTSSRTLSFACGAYACELTLYADVDESASVYTVTDREVRAVLTKMPEAQPANSEEEEGAQQKQNAKTSSFWPRLLDSTLRQHWLRVDFARWVDEDDDAYGASMPPLGGDPFDGYDFNDPDFANNMLASGAGNGRGFGDNDMGSDDDNEDDYDDDDEDNNNHNHNDDNDDDVDYEGNGSADASGKVDHGRRAVIPRGMCLDCDYERDKMEASTAAAAAAAAGDEKLEVSGKGAGAENTNADDATTA